MYYFSIFIIFTLFCFDRRSDCYVGGVSFCIVVHPHYCYYFRKWKQRNANNTCWLRRECLQFPSIHEREIIDSAVIISTVDEIVFPTNTIERTTNVMPANLLTSNRFPFEMNSLLNPIEWIVLTSKNRRQLKPVRHSLKSDRSSTFEYLVKSNAWNTIFGQLNFSNSGLIYCGLSKNHFMVWAALNSIVRSLAMHSTRSRDIEWHTEWNWIDMMSVDVHFCF